jgi:hypothetical protein
MFIQANCNKLRIVVVVIVIVVVVVVVIIIIIIIIIIYFSGRTYCLNTIPSTLNVSEITSKFRILAMFLTIDL